MDRLSNRILSVEHITKKYRGGVVANDDISINIYPGEVFGLLGPNGAGKTTLVNQIIGLTVPNSGSIRIAGIDIVRHPDYARQNCSFQSQTQVPIAGLTTRQAIMLVGRIRGGNRRQVLTETQALIDELEIGEWADRDSSTFSGGVRRLVAFCMAAVVPRSIMILDEPTNDVDPLRRRLLWRVIRRIANDGTAVLLVTHNVLEAERAVDRLAIIYDSRVVGQGSPASLKGNCDDRMRLELTIEPGQAPPEPPEFIHVYAQNHRLIAMVEPQDMSAAIDWARNLKDAGGVEEFSLGPITLEDIYVRIVGQANATKTSEGDTQDAALVT